jgi:hypothetical protein
VYWKVINVTEAFPFLPQSSQVTGHVTLTYGEGQLYHSRHTSIPYRDITGSSVAEIIKNTVMQTTEKNQVIFFSVHHSKF